MILDQSYFTKNSFSIINDPVRKPFLIVEFMPVEEYKFFVKSSINDSSYTTSEQPGIYMESEESYKRDDFNLVKHAIIAWTDRIKEDLDASRNIHDEDIEIFLDNLHRSFKIHENTTGFFSKKEVLVITQKLNTLEIAVLKLSKKLETPENIINSFRLVLEDVKKDLLTYKKSTWYKIAGNKVIKSVKSVIYNGTKEDREFLYEEITKLIEKKDID